VDKHGAVGGSTCSSGRCSDRARCRGRLSPKAARRRGEVPVGEAGELQWNLGQLLVPEGEAEGILTGLSTTAGCGDRRRRGAEPRGRPARREKEGGCCGALIAKEAGAGRGSTSPLARAAPRGDGTARRASGASRACRVDCSPSSNRIRNLNKFKLIWK
jgi:hypothetical protein